MLNTYGKLNYEVEVPLSIEYSKSTVHPSGGQYGSSAQYMYTRHVTKTYRFKGMSASTAQSCLAAKKRQYMRKFMGWKLKGSSWMNKHYYERYGSMSQAPSDYYAQVATFNVVRNGTAPTFDVQITMDESVNIYLTLDYDLTNTNDIAALEAHFQNSSTTSSYCYVSTYDYDENLT